jgi:hypothetical protein
VIAENEGKTTIPQPASQPFAQPVIMSASILLTYRWFNRWSELKAVQKITRKLLKMLVADAVQVEPVSTAKFPANREKNREFYRIVSFGSVRDCKQRRRYRASEPNSLLNRTGNYFGGTGNLGARTGNSLGQN